MSDCCDHGCYFCHGEGGYHSNGCCGGAACDGPRVEADPRLTLWLQMEEVWKQEVRDWLREERRYKAEQRRVARQEQVVHQQEAWDEFTKRVITEWLDAEAKYKAKQSEQAEVDKAEVRAKMAGARRDNRVHVPAKGNAPKTKAQAELRKKLGVH